MSTAHHFPVFFAFLILSLILLSVQVFSDSGEDANTKIEWHDLTIGQLTDSYFEAFGSDVSMLRMSRCKFNEIDVNAFDRFKHLNLLDISDSELKKPLHYDTFSRIPALEILILRHVGLDEVSLNLTNVQELILSENNIRDFAADEIDGKNVNYLDLSGNKIRRLDSSMSSMKKLSMIDLSKNDIESIGSDVFRHNPNLLRILASENKLKNTDGLRFRRLKTLDLFKNQLTELTPDSFAKMPFLEDLVLAFNSIRHIDDPFKDLLELKFLNLAWNSIDQIQPDLFRNNLYLSHLSLQGNKIKSLERFKSVHQHLFKLDLSHNELDYIDNEFFNSMPNLSILDLTFNRLKVLTDILQPLSKLKVLSVAYNQLILAGYEFQNNQQMTQLNLSSNLLELKLSHFKNNGELTALDLSKNFISDFCEGGVSLAKLRKINLKGNHISDLSCLKSKRFESLCLIELQNNPLTCGDGLDDVILTMAKRRGSPYKLADEFLADAVQDQCENISRKESFRRWNLIKRELCPSGKNLQDPQPNIKLNAIDDVEDEDEDDADDDDDNEHDDDDDDDDDDGDDDDNDDDDDDDDIETDDDDDYSSSDESYVESSEDQSIEHQQQQQRHPKEPQPIEAHQEKKEDKGKHLIIIPIRKMNKHMFEDDDKESRSERMSWEKMSKNPNFDNGFEDHEASPGHYNWYTIVLGLIGICLILTCFNLLVFLYIRFRVWKRSDVNNPQKYTFLKNEVYKNTTEPTKLESARDSLWFPRDENNVKTKVFSYGKINEILHSFGNQRRDPDSESTKNILIQPASNPNLPNC